MLEVDLQWLTLISAVVLPALVALVTKQVANPGLKGVLLAAFSGVTTIVGVWIDKGGSIPFDLFLFTFTRTFVTAVAVHYALLKPLNVTGTAGVIQASTANFGIGDSQPNAPLDSPFAKGQVGNVPVGYPAPVSDPSNVGAVVYNEAPVGLAGGNAAALYEEASRVDKFSSSAGGMGGADRDAEIQASETCESMYHGERCLLPPGHSGKHVRQSTDPATVKATPVRGGR